MICLESKSNKSKIHFKNKNNLFSPGVSVAIGFFAGIISTFGFEKVKPFVSEKLYHVK